MERQLENLAICVSFFTRVPLPGVLSRYLQHDTRLSDAIAWFPLTGLLIGIPPALRCFTHPVKLLPALISAGLAIGLGILITGALHEDGLADSADGLGATSQRERALEIMRDSSIGTYGSLALILSVGLRWAALASLAPLAGVLAILIAHSGSRSAMTAAMQLSSYVRKEGLGKQVDYELPENGFVIATGMALAVALLLGGLGGLLAVLIAYVTAWGLVKYFEHRLGGYTGDSLGAIQQVSEIAILVALASTWSPA